MRLDTRSGAAVWILLLASLPLVAASCQPRPQAPPPEPPAASDELVGDIRTRYQQINPHARVGLIIAVLEDRPYAAIGDIDVASFKEGDTVQIIDSSETFLTNAEVVNITQEQVHVRFEEDGSARRPRTGDVAVKLGS
ncbi:MAG: hypothetical protein ACREIT_10110 [Tepidisphaeraceae bacterium]